MKKLFLFLFLFFIISGCSLGFKDGLIKENAAQKIVAKEGIIYEEVGDFGNILAFAEKAQSLAKEKLSADAKLKMIILKTPKENTFFSYEAFFYSESLKTEEGRPGLLTVCYNNKVDYSKNYSPAAEKNDKLIAVIHQDDNYLPMNAEGFEPKELNKSLPDILSIPCGQKNGFCTTRIRNNTYKSPNPLAGLLTFSWEGAEYNAKTGEKIK